jgi:hypothetical protein
VISYHFEGIVSADSSRGNRIYRIFAQTLARPAQYSGVSHKKESLNRPHLAKVLLGSEEAHSFAACFGC